MHYLIKKQDVNKNMKLLDTKLLFRASEHGFDRDKFHQFCDNKGPTIAIIHNEHDHVFGGYVERSWIDVSDDDVAKKMADPNAFLFGVRPNIKYIPLKEGKKDGASAMWVHEKYGPIFGGGADIWIIDKCDKLKKSGVYSYTFEFDPAKICGVDSGYMSFLVKEYEVFSVCIQ